MKTFIQTNFNECGVCAISSYVEHFYNKNKKTEILDEANITRNGLSLYDFEILASKFGLDCHSYELQCEELYSNKISKYFVALLKNESGLHYVICSLKDKSFHIWDSLIGEYDLSFNEFKEKFSNIIILITKNKLKIKFDNKKFNFVNCIDFRIIFISVILNIICIITCIYGANFLNTVIENSLNNMIFKNTIIISFTFFLIFITNFISKYILSLFEFDNARKCFNLLSERYIKSIGNKTKNFLNKVNENNIYLVDHAMHSICNYCMCDISNLIANIILIFGLVIIISFTNYLFLSVCIGIFLISCIFGYIRYIQKQKILKSTFNNSSVNIGINFECVNYLKNKNNFLQLEQINKKLKQNYFQYTNIWKQDSYFHFHLQLIEDIVEKALEIFLIVIGAYSIITLENLTIGTLIFLITLVNIFANTIKSIINFVPVNIEYKTLSEIYNNVINIENADDGNVILESVSKITLKQNNKTNEINNNSVISFDLDKYLIEQNNNDILINDISIKDIKKESINEKLLVIDKTTSIDKYILKKYIGNQNVLKFIQAFKESIDENSHEILINLLICSFYHGKIIILKNIDKLLTNKEINYYKKEIIPILIKNNFVVNIISY